MHTLVYSTHCPKCDSTRVQATLERPNGERFQTCTRGHLSQSRIVDYHAACGYLEFMLSECPAARVSPSIFDVPNAKDVTAVTQFDEFKDWHSLDGKKTAMEYQRDGVAFAEKAQACALIADEMGLGKTIQAALLLRRNLAVITPCVIFCPAQIIYQWANELRQWTVDTDKDISGILPVGNRDQIFPGFRIYIMSMDLIGRSGVAQKLAACGIKAVIIDECHRLKDRDAKRTKAVRAFCKDNNIQFRIGLSGTPIKNRVSEFWSTFNILRPDQFSSFSDFCNWYLVRNEKNVYTRLNPAMEETFRNMTAEFMIRRKKSDVLTNLPAITRDYQIIEIEDDSIRQSYNNKLGLFQAFLNSNDDRITSLALLGWLAQMRQITGQAKIMNALQWTEDFLESTEESIIIGTLHDAVRDGMFYALQNKKFPVAKLSGENNAWEKDRIVQDFRSGAKRVLVMNMKSGGEGLNLQTASNILVIERMWNAADEEQVEARIHRMGQSKPCTATYTIAKGTIDEWLHNLIQEKKDSCARGLGDTLALESESLSSLLEFSNFVCSHTI